MKKNIFILTLLSFLFSHALYSQNDVCNGANPFCSNQGAVNFPAGVNATPAQSGPNYGCLGSQPNPAWYYMQVGTGGTIEIEMHSTPQHDIDFCCWGPFTSSTTPCVAQLTAGSPTPNHHAPGVSSSYPTLNMIDCSYDPSWQEWCYLPNAVAGTYYILLITNYSNQPCNIIFSQTSGTGSTNCGILAPPITGDTVCEGKTINLHVNAPTSGASYSWTGPNGFTSTLMNPAIPNATTAMSGTYSLVITIGSQVSPPVTCNVQVNTNPTVTISPTNPTTCPGSPVSLTPACSHGLAWYTWSEGTQGTGGITVSPTAPTSYSVTGSDIKGCSDADTVTVIMNPDLVLSVTPGNPFICEGSSVNLTVTGGNTYTWTPTSTLSSGTDTTVTATPVVFPTTYTVVGTATTGCTGSTTVTINRNPDLIISVNPPNPSICKGRSVNLTGAGANSYTWSADPTLSSTSGATVTASPVSQTTYTVVGTATTGCTGDTTVTVNISPDLILSVNPSNPSICIGTSINLTGMGADTYSWSPSDSLSSTTGTVITASPIVNTTYTVNGIDAAGCTGITPVTITVNPPPPTSISATPPRVCPGDSSLLGVALLGTNYIWSPVTSLSNPNGQFTSARPISTTTYSVVADNNGCSSTASYTLEVMPLPDVNFTADIREGCQGLKVHFQDLTLPAVNSWNWIFGNNSNRSTSSLQNPYNYFPDAGIFDVTLSVETIDGCKMGLTVPDYITIHAIPQAEFAVNPPKLNELDPLAFFEDQSLLTTEWNWYFGDRNLTNNTSNLQYPNHIYSDTGTFFPTLIVFSDYGCSDTTTRTIVVEQNIDFYIPNAFRPGEGNYNANFRPYGEGIDLNKFEMRIYNRWGEQVFFTHDMEKGWDGKINGSKLASEGLYSWFLSYYDVKFKYHELKGNLMLLK
jgi:trimeric autotransporter adhesin